MELFTKLFGDLLVFVYHCFDRIVIHGYLSGLSRPEQVVYFFRQVLGVPVVSKEVLSQRTTDYQAWVEAFARNHDIPIEWAEKGVRKEDYVQPWLRKMVRRNAYGVYFIFKSMEQGPSFRITTPKFPTKDPNHRILARQKSRFTHNYFYIRDEVLGPMVMRVATRPSRCGRFKLLWHREGYVRRRGTVSRKPAKTKHRKPTRPERRDAAKATRQTNLSASKSPEPRKVGA